MKISALWKTVKLINFPTYRQIATPANSRASI
jgi:hypothetical protein